MIEIISYQEVKGRDKELAKKEFDNLLEKIKEEYRSPHTFRANSITAHCMPRQIPKNGIFCSRA